MQQQQDGTQAVPQQWPQQLLQLVDPLDPQYVLQTCRGESKDSSTVTTLNTDRPLINSLGTPQVQLMQ